MLKDAWKYIDNSVGLNVFHVWVLEAELVSATLCGADDPCSHSVLQGERAAHGHHKLPGSKVRRAAQHKHRQRALTGTKKTQC